MANWRNRIVGYGEMDTEQMLANPNNWRIHPKYQQDALEGVLKEVGVVQNIIVNKTTGFVVDGHARVSLALRTHQPTIPVTFVEITPEEEQIIIATFDPIGAHAVSDKEKLEQLLDSAIVEDAKVEEFFSLIREEEALGNYLGVDKKAKPKSRKLPLDLILTVGNTPIYVYLAKACGIHWGIQSQRTMLRDDWAMPNVLTFIDNDYLKYNHELHLDVIKKYKPKYATVRDIMTEGQCERAGIAYYSYEQILAWAEELSQYAENVIMIPKYDIIDKIPEKYMLGYSVPSSHGSTPLPVEAFKGRRVHLLGGSWRLQLAHMAQLGDDVVSIDNNYEFKMAKYGQYITPDGDGRNLSKFLDCHINNPLTVAMAITLGAMGAKLNELLGTKDHEEHIESEEHETEQEER